MDRAAAHARGAQGEHPECGVVHEPIERAVAALAGRELPDEVAAREVTRRDASRAQREDGALEVTDVLEPARVRAHVIDGGPSGAAGRVRAVPGGRDAERRPARVRLVRGRAGRGPKATVAVL